jgi:hypothetical protein
VALTKVQTSRIPGPSIAVNIAMSQVSFLAHIVMWLRGLVFEGDWPSRTEVSQRDAWAYEQLRGHTVPYLYGFYTVICISFIIIWFANVDV